MELAACSCRAALVMVGPYPMEVPCANERPLFIVMRSWCDVQAAVFNAKLAQRALRGIGAPALAVTGMRRGTRACCPRAMRRCFYAVCILRKGTATARGLSPSVRIRGVACQPQPPTPNQRYVP